MQIKPIHTRGDYLRALKEVQADWETDFPAGSPEGERYEVLLTLVEAYEAEHFPIADPDPIEAIKIRMEDKGLENKDLLPIFGTRARVYEVLNKLRGLSVDHIRELNKRLEIPAEILLKKYRLKAPKSSGKKRKPKKQKKAA
jgi:HTH-type transcriptional regulator/antitoxin HigA